MKSLLPLLLVAILSTAALSAPRKQYLRTVKCDTSKVIVQQTLTVLKYDTVKVVNQYKDTLKLIKSDTTRSVRIDTLAPVKPIRTPVVKK